MSWRRAAKLPAERPALSVAGYPPTSTASKAVFDVATVFMHGTCSLLRELTLVNEAYCS